MPLDEVGRYYARIFVNGREWRVYEGQTIHAAGHVEIMDDLPDNVVIQGKGHVVKITYIE